MKKSEKDNVGPATHGFVKKWWKNNQDYELIMTFWTN